MEGVATGHDDGLTTATTACPWCRRELPTTAQPFRKFCSRRCRQAAFRLRRRCGLEDDGSTIVHDDGPSSCDRATTALRFAYADPPYPGTAAKYYGDQPDYAGEVDHVELIAKLTGGAYDGWALSTSARALRDTLPVCPPEARVCCWAKDREVPRRTYGLHNSWEAVIVVQGRRLQPGRPDLLIARPARLGGSSLPGRKPIAFCAWLFQCLGMLPGDELDDLFPGSGIVAAAWRELSSTASSDGPSSAAGSDSFPPAGATP